MLNPANVSTATACYVLYCFVCSVFVVRCLLICYVLRPSSVTTAALGPLLENVALSSWFV